MPYTGCKPGGGANLKIGGKVGKQLVRAVSRNPKLTAKDLHCQALTGGVDCSVGTVQRFLTAAGLCSKRPVPKPLLLPHHIQARLAFARDVVDQDWSQVLFSDEATFWLESCVRRVWDRKGMKFVARKIKYPQKLQVLGLCVCCRVWTPFNLPGHHECRTPVPGVSEGTPSLCKKALWTLHH